jgi:hypothetical protein
LQSEPESDRQVPQGRVSQRLDEIAKQEKIKAFNAQQKAADALKALNQANEKIKRLQEQLDNPPLASQVNPQKDVLKLLQQDPVPNIPKKPHPKIKKTEKDPVWKAKFPPFHKLRQGDVIGLKIAGVSEKYTARIDQDGTVTLPQIGTIQASGKNQLELKSAIENINHVSGISVTIEHISHYNGHRE